MWAVLTALAAAGCFAVSTSLQHHCAEAAPASAVTSRQLIWHLAHRPLWLFGMGMGGVGFVLHALALQLGALAVVQPILVTGIVFALPVRAALYRQTPSARNIWWAALTATALAVFLVVSHPSAGHEAPDRVAAMLFVAVAVATAAVASRVGVRPGSPRLTGLLLGAGAGVLFGTVAGVTKLAVTVLAAEGAVGLLLDWPLWTLAALGGCGLAVNQRAYKSAPLPYSMPVLNIISPLVAIAYGFYIFGEQPADGPWALLVQLAALATMSVGVLALTRATSSAPSTPALDRT